MATFVHQLLIAFFIFLTVHPVTAIDLSAEFTEFYDGAVVRSYNYSTYDLANHAANFDALGRGTLPYVPNGPVHNARRLDGASGCGAEYELSTQDASSISSIYGSWVIPKLIQRSEGIPDNPTLNWQWIVEWVGIDNIGADGQLSQDCSLLDVGVLSVIYGNHESSRQENTAFWAMLPQQQVPINMEIGNDDSVAVNVTVVSEKKAIIWILFNLTDVHATTSSGKKIDLNGATLVAAKQSDPDGHNAVTLCTPVQMDSTTLEFYPY